MCGAQRPKQVKIMKVFNSPSNLPPFNSGTCVTWGNFDGVHLGHQKLLGHLAAKARQFGLTSVVVTFSPHPLHVIGTPPPIITSMHARLKLIAAQGIDVTLVLPFTKEISELEPEDFVHKILTGNMQTRQMVLGYSSFFGKGRRGSALLLSRMGEELGFGVEQLSPVLLGGSVVSSTRVRRLIGAGQVAEVAPLLGRNHFVEGHIVKGRQLGHTLGFPTINVEAGLKNTNDSGYQAIPGVCSNEFDALGGLLPPDGVYAAWAEISGRFNQGVASIGTNPTFENSHGKIARKLEVHILDFNQDVYGQDVRVHFVKHIRVSQRFDSPEQLKKEINSDIEKTKKIL